MPKYCWHLLELVQAAVFKPSRLCGAPVTLGPMFPAFLCAFPLWACEGLFALATSLSLCAVNPSSKLNGSSFLRKAILEWSPLSKNEVVARSTSLQHSFQGAATSTAAHLGLSRCTPPNHALTSYFVELQAVQCRAVKIRPLGETEAA